MTFGLTACGSGSGQQESSNAGNGESGQSGQSNVASDEGISPDSPYAGKGFDLSEHKDMVMYAISDRPADMDRVLEKLNQEYLEPWLNVILSIEFLPWGVAGEKYPLMTSGRQRFAQFDCGDGTFVTEIPENSPGSEQAKRFGMESTVLVTLGNDMDSRQGIFEIKMLVEAGKELGIGMFATPYGKARNSEDSPWNLFAM